MNNRDLIKSYRSDWNKFVRDVGKVKLDKEQQDILSAIQTCRRVSVRSGTARGKDFVSACAAVCFLYLTPKFVNGKIIEATKVALTAPTGRQIRNIMIPEISKFYQKLNRYLGDLGDLMADGIRFQDYKDWFLVGFKAGDENVEAWSGLHAPNIMVVVTEASGISQTTFDSIEGILQGNSRLVIVFNPNNTSGEAYNSTRSPLYKSFRLNCLKSPNVVAKKILIPGQVDWDWVDEKIRKPGWVTSITKEEMNPGFCDFEWEGKYYRPGNLFRVKVLGEFPATSDDILVPLAWIEAANNRWKEMMSDRNLALREDDNMLGVDVAGMGRDNSIFCNRNKRHNLVTKIEVLPMQKTATIHMEVAGRIKNEIQKGGYALIDTIGEGAGVYSRLIEQGIFNAVSCKYSYGAGDMTDFTGEYKFANMKAYLFWAIRDALNPAYNLNLALPPCDELTQELTETHWKIQSNGAIIIESKEDIKKRIGRSTDYADALANSFWPESRLENSFESEGELISVEL